MYVVALYEIDMAYGGPEEGGWYYDTGDLRGILRTAPTEDAARAIARRVNDWLARIQRNARPVSSVLYGGGRYTARVYCKRAPDFYPAERPHYS